MKASVVIITYNRSQVIGRCLDSLIGQTVKPDSIIVIDSSNDDKTEKIVKEYDVAYKHSARRLYQPQARNLGLKIVETPIVAFGDDDSVFTRDWLRNILLGYGEKNIAGVCGPIVETSNDLKKVLKQSTPQIKQIMWGGNMSFVTDKLREVGGFDDFFSKYDGWGEEGFPSIGLFVRGYRFKYMPKAIVYHVKSYSGGARSENRNDILYEKDRGYSDWTIQCRKHIMDTWFSDFRLKRLRWLAYHITTH